MTLSIPTVHMNGTARDALIDQLTTAAEGIRDAIKLLADASPNGRDYYPQGDDAIVVAGRQHRERIVKLQSVHDELELIAEGIAAQAYRGR